MKCLPLMKITRSHNYVCTYIVSGIKLRALHFMLTNFFVWTSISHGFWVADVRRNFWIDFHSLCATKINGIIGSLLLKAFSNWYLRNNKVWHIVAQLYSWHSYLFCCPVFDALFIEFVFCVYFCALSFFLS